MVVSNREDCGLTDEDVLKTAVYFAIFAVAEAWHVIAPDWSTALVTADVCRGDLLIEVEVVARAGQGTLHITEPIKFSDMDLRFMDR